MKSLRVHLAPHTACLSLLILIPLLAHGFILSGFVQCDPAIAYSQMSRILKPALLQGAAGYVDPGVGAITQPLGFLSAQDWLHGIIPWWNPYNGLGMPLAAGMQAESFFLPIVLLLHFHAGWLIQLLLFEATSGLLTYAFLLTIGISPVGALLGGALFSLNGTFILTPGAVSAPIMFLPLLMLGIERATKAATQRKPGGWSLVVVAVAGSIYAGFPMVAYFDGLLAAAWAALRLAQSNQKRSLFLKLATGCGIGVALTAPLLNAFLQNLQTGFLGIQSFSGHLNLPPMAAPLQIFPLFYGALASFPPAGLDDQGLWIRIGGWFGCIPLALGLYALLGHHHRAAKALLLAWILAFQARYFGAPGFITLFNLIPGISLGDVVRFSTPASDFAIIILAAWGYSELEQRHRLSRGELKLLFGCFAACIIFALYPVRHVILPWFAGYPSLLAFAVLYMALTAIAILTIAAAIVTGRCIRAVPILAIAGAIGVTLISQLGAARVTSYDPSALTYLHDHDNLSRFYTLGPVMPNLAAADDVASINYLLLPVPKLWTSFIRTSLFPGSDLSVFAGNQPGQSTALRRHLPNFAAIGVGTILTAAGPNPFDSNVFLPAPAASVQYLGFPPGAEVSATLTQPSWPITRIDAVSIRIGTYFGQARGILAVRLCAGNHCASGQASIDSAPDNQPLQVPLSQPLTPPIVPASLTFTLTHPTGSPVAITLADQPDVTINRSSLPQIAQHLSPRLGFIQSAATQPRIVFHNQFVDLYAVPNPAPYMQTADPACTLTIIDRQHARTNCPHPTNLIRRELFFAGWRVSINNTEQPIQPMDEIFQATSLPAGPAEITFSYMPLHTHAACALALAALLLWCACLLEQAFRQKRKA